MPSVIILTQYYPPETGAPQNRLHSLARYLATGDNDVRVVTALPSYPKNEIFAGYKGRYRMEEMIDGVPVHRAWIFVSASRGTVARLLNYFSFVLTSFFVLLKLPRAKYIICESPPLFLGVTAVFISRLKGSRLIFNVSDLWPESAEKLSIISNRFLLSMAYKLEKWIYRNAFLISGQTRGIVQNIQDRFPSKNVVWFPNGVDIAFFESDFEPFAWRAALGIAPADFVVLYAGIIGHAQGLEVILDAADALRGRPIKFVIVGDGPERQKLNTEAEKRDLSSVIFHPNLEKVRIPSLISECDAYVVPLKKLDLFKGAIPSKLFEPLSMGKPILLGVDGEARELFINEGKGGLYFEPENGDSLAEQILVLFGDRALRESTGRQGQQYVKQNFDRQHIHRRFVEHLEPA